MPGPPQGEAAEFVARLGIPRGVRRCRVLRKPFKGMKLRCGGLFMGPWVKIAIFLSRFLLHGRTSCSIMDMLT